MKLAMNVFGAFVFLAGSLLGAQHSSAQATSTSPLAAVDYVDLRRYAGKLIVRDDGLVTEDRSFLRGVS
jgi:hypothetical protein